MRIAMVPRWALVLNVPETRGNEGEIEDAYARRTRQRKAFCIPDCGAAFPAPPVFHRHPRKNMPATQNLRRLAGVATATVAVTALLAGCATSSSSPDSSNGTQTINFQTSWIPLVQFG